MLRRVAVGGEIINDLRQKAAPVNGVCAGEQHAVFIELFADFRICKNTLHAGLCVVKIALDCAHRNVFALLRVHLALLHGADALIRIKHENFGVGYVAEALQRRLTRITGGGHENHSRFIAVCLFQRPGQQMRQKLQSHIFKGAGRPVPQLQKSLAALRNAVKRRRTAGKFLFGIGTFHAFTDFLRGKLRQKIGQNAGGPLGVAAFAEHL